MNKTELSVLSVTAALGFAFSGPGFAEDSYANLSGANISGTNSTATTQAAIPTPVNPSIPQPLAGPNGCNCSDTRGMVDSNMMTGQTNCQCAAPNGVPINQAAGSLAPDLTTPDLPNSPPATLPNSSGGPLNGAPLNGAPPISGGSTSTPLTPGAGSLGVGR